jgi:phosphoglycolate phosphatase
MEPQVSVLITDLDNTLYDWFEAWYHSFSSMLDSLVRISGINRDELLDEIKTIHETHGTSEYFLLIHEIPSLKKLHPSENLSILYLEAIDAYQEARKQYLSLYPGVLTTLKSIKKYGSLIVAYTESQSFYSEFRVKELGLDGIIDYLYSPQSHDIPNNLSPEQKYLYPYHYDKLKSTVHRHTPKDEIKPNPLILKAIINEIGTGFEEVVYVGDNLSKDIAMAQAVPVFDVLAQYGTAHRREEYDLLRRVTHWTTEQVRKEKESEQLGIIPTFILKESFEELLDLFDFVSFGEENE